MHPTRRTFCRALLPAALSGSGRPRCRRALPFHCPV